MNSSRHPAIHSLAPLLLAAVICCRANTSQADTKLDSTIPDTADIPALVQSECRGLKKQLHAAHNVPIGKEVEDRPLPYLPEEFLALPDFETDTVLAASNDRINYGAQGVPLPRVVESICRQTTISLILRGRSARKRTNIILRTASPRQALVQFVTETPEILMRRPPGTSGVYEIWDRETFATDVVPALIQHRVFELKTLSTADAAEIATKMKTPGFGSVVRVDSTRRIVVNDLPRTLEKIATVLAEADKTRASSAL